MEVSGTFGIRCVLSVIALILLNKKRQPQLKRFPLFMSVLQLCLIMPFFHVTIMIEFNKISSNRNNELILLQKY